MEWAFQVLEVSSKSEDGDGENGAVWGWGAVLWGLGWAESKPGAEHWLLGEPPCVLTAEVAEFLQALCLSNQADGAQPMAVPLPTTLA